MAGVILENVSRAYPGHVAVDGVDLEVFDREFLVLVGPSGCGKTTTLRLIAGLEEPTSGTISIGSRVVNDVPAKHRDIAMVFQNYALYPHMNVYRNMAFGLELREGLGGVRRLWRWALPTRLKAPWAARRFAIATRVHEAARMLSIEHLLERFPRQLSGGERQRVALGRAIVRHPAVFLFDEPLSNLDAKLRVEMRRELKQLHRRLAATMIYVTHDQVEALTLGQRIVVMNEARVQQVGPPMDVYDWPANRFVAGFIGTPAMNFVRGELTSGTPRGFRSGRWALGLSRRELEGVVGPRPAILGCRPEDVRIVPPGTPGALEARVEVVEMLGDATLVTLHSDALSGDALSRPDNESYQAHQDDGGYVMMKMEPHRGVQPGDRLLVGVREDRLHLFDPATGRNWVRRPGGD
jgi:multiple sugar transport system ATP-binding protein